MSGFTRDRRSKRIVATFTGFEADLLRSLASQLIELLRNEEAAPVEHLDPLEAMMDFSGPTTEPEDPVLARLFPSAYQGDQESSGDFRRFTEGALRDSKSSAAVAIVTELEEAGLPDQPADESLMIDVELDPDQAVVWLRSFTDLRLALATRLGVTDDDEEYWAGLDDEDPRSQAHDIYEWIGYLQETLVMALQR